MKILLRNSVLLLLSFNLLILFTNASASALKLAFFAIIITSFCLRINRVKKANAYKNNLLGLNFFLFYFIANALGLAYGYDYRFTVIGLLIILPVFSAYFIDAKFISNEIIFKWIKVFAIITTIFSIVMFFGWDKIPWLRQFVEQQAGTDSGFLTRSYNEKGIAGRFFRSTGIFGDFYQNGLFILMGAVISIEDFIRKKASGFITFILICLYGVGIYTTQTRNIYLLSGLVILSYLLLYIKITKKKYCFFILLILMYIVIMLSGIYFAGSSLEEGASLYARYYSWQKISTEYFLDNLSSFHVIIGYALIQFKTDFSPHVSYWAIDNSILAVFLGSGIIGVVLFLRWLSNVFNFLIKNYYQSRDVYLRSNLRTIIIFFVIYFLGGAMNVNMYDIYFVLPLLFFLKRTHLELINEKRVSKFGLTIAVKLNY